MNAKSSSAKVLGLVAQSGALGATSFEIAGWSGMALAQVETHLKALRRQGRITRFPALRATPQGGLTPIYHVTQEVPE